MSIETLLETMPNITREQRQAILAAQEVPEKLDLIYLELFRIRKGMEDLVEKKLEMHPE